MTKIVNIYEYKWYHYDYYYYYDKKSNYDKFYD